LFLARRFVNGEVIEPRASKWLATVVAHENPFEHPGTSDPREESAHLTTRTQVIATDLPTNLKVTGPAFVKRQKAPEEFVLGTWRRGGA